MATTTSKRAIIEKVNSAFAENNMEGVLAFCADDIEWTMIGDKTAKGKDGIRQWMSAAPPEPPKFAVKSMIAEGDFVVAYGDGIMKDENQADAPYSYCDLYRFRGGKIVEMRSWVIKTSAEAATI